MISGEGEKAELVHREKPVAGACLFVTLMAPGWAIKLFFHLYTLEMTFSREHSTMWTRRVLERLNDRLGTIADCEQQKKDVEEFVRLSASFYLIRRKVLWCLSLLPWPPSVHIALFELVLGLYTLRHTTLFPHNPFYHLYNTLHHFRSNMFLMLLNAV